MSGRGKNLKTSPTKKVGGPKKAIKKGSPKKSEPHFSGNLVDTCVTKVEEVAVTIFRMGREPNKADYTNEHMKYWNENLEEAAKQWGIHKWVVLRNPDVDGQIAKFVAPQVNYEWKVALTYSYELEDGDDFKKNSVKMAAEFEKFARQCSSVSFIYG